MDEPPFQIILSELDRIRSAGFRERVNLSALSRKAGVSKQYLSDIIHGRRRCGVDIPVRIACVLGSDCETTDRIIHASGYDISMNWNIKNKHYRAALGADNLDDINAALDGAGTYVCGCF